ncbi:MAG: hypothetical protein C0485_13455 [Pirellula sp.]|nr:hypothetical protein [Pirellula sp.]
MNAAATSSPIKSPTSASVEGSRFLNIALAATVALSAWLIFQVQPMVAKRILPWFGGGTAVWTTVMLFFQSALFFGYLYAHLSTRWLTPARQVRFHIALLAAAAMLAAILGVLPTDSWRPSDNQQPALHILFMLSVAVGLPYLALAATAPLTQVWFARVHPGRSPYRLYALSNAGSLAALLSYPFLVEPNLGVAAQGTAWASLFVIFAVLCTASGLASLWSSSAGSASDRAIAHAATASKADVDDSKRPLQRFFWLALPALASVALLAITNHLCQDILSAPLLWIAPMVVYLLSFILTFDSDRWYRRDVWMPLGAVASFAAALSWQRRIHVDVSVLLAINLTLLASICMICHGELVRLRPAARRLTAFYLSIAAGGAIGGLLVGIVAPLVLNDYYELQLGVIAVWLLAFVLLVTDKKSPYFDGGKGLVFKSLLAMAGLLAALCVLMYAGVSRQWAGHMAQDRSFFGVLKVRYLRASTGEEYYGLTNGRISHGGQFKEPEHHRVPMLYYHPDTGVGKVLVQHDPEHPRRVGVIGLGAGTIAAFAEPKETFRFYDINPQVITYAERIFSYLDDARNRGAAIEIVEGDARLALESEPPQNFDVLVLDAFNSDAIPAHLLTLEAFELYLRHLQDPDGIIAVHISSDHLELTPVVRAAAEHFNLDGIVLEGVPDGTPNTAPCVWVLLGRGEGRLSGQGIGTPLSEHAKDRPAVNWTDDYSSLLDVLVH